MPTISGFYIPPANSPATPATARGSGEEFSSVRPLTRSLEAGEGAAAAAGASAQALLLRSREN